MKRTAFVAGDAMPGRTLSGLGYHVTAPDFDPAEPLSVDDAAASFGPGPLDLLVLGTEWRSRACPAASAAGQDWRRAMLVNAYAPFRLAVKLRPNLEAGAGKTVLAVTSPLSSLAGVGADDEYVFRASKVALNALMRCLSMEWRKLGIVCLLLASGDISPSELDRLLRREPPMDTGLMMDAEGSVIPW